MTLPGERSFLASRDVIDTPAGDFLVLSRRDAAHRTLSVPYIVISITNVGSPIADLADSPLRRAVLRLQFWDAVGEGGLTHTQADAAARFVKEHQTEIRGVLVHCELGISRSAGMAAGIAEAMNGDLDTRFREWYSCNEGVRRMFVEAAKRCGLWDPAALLRAQGLWPQAADGGHEWGEEL